MKKRRGGKRGVEEEKAVAAPLSKMEWEGQFLEGLWWEKKGTQGWLQERGGAPRS